jgi:hypothetical protein
MQMLSIIKMECVLGGGFCTKLGCVSLLTFQGLTPEEIDAYMKQHQEEPEEGVL